MLISSFPLALRWSLPLLLPLLACDSGTRLLTPCWAHLETTERVSAALAHPPLGHQGRLFVDAASLGEGGAVQL